MTQNTKQDGVLNRIRAAAAALISATATTPPCYEHIQRVLGNAADPALRTHGDPIGRLYHCPRQTPHPANSKSENALQRFRGPYFQRALPGLHRKTTGQKLFHAFSCALLGQADQMGRIIQ